MKMYNPILEMIQSTAQQWGREINTSYRNLDDPGCKKTLEKISAKLQEVESLAKAGQDRFKEDLLIFRSTRRAGVIAEDGEAPYPVYRYLNDLSIEIADIGYRLVLGRDTIEDEDLALLEQYLFEWALSEGYTLEEEQS